MYSGVRWCGQQYPLAVFDVWLAPVDLQPAQRHCGNHFRYPPAGAARGPHDAPPDRAASTCALRRHAPADGNRVESHGPILFVPGHREWLFCVR